MNDTKIIEATAQATAERVVSELKRQGLMKDNKQTPFQKTETLLYNYENFKGAIADKMQEIEEIRMYGVPKRSPSIGSFSGNPTYEVKNMNEWGVLQYFDTLQKDENGKAKADALLELYNKKTRNLTVKNALGDTRVHAGTMVVVQLDLGDIKLKNMMLVEKCKHTFKNDEHFMDLTLRGGEFVV